MTTTLEELNRRVNALEAAQNDTTQTLRWVVAKLGRMSAVQDEHTLRLERIESDVSTLKSDVATLKSDVSTLKSDVSTLKSDMAYVKSDLRALRDELPTIVGDVVRAVFAERDKRG